jgi:hypothetical protein
MALDQAVHQAVSKTRPKPPIAMLDIAFDDIFFRIIHEVLKLVQIWSAGVVHPKTSRF